MDFSLIKRRRLSPITELSKIEAKSSAFINYLFICMTIPGEQNPHWVPWNAANRSWIGCMSSFLLPNPSTVTTCHPSQLNTGVMHCNETNKWHDDYAEPLTDMIYSQNSRCWHDIPCQLLQKEHRLSQRTLRNRLDGTLLSCRSNWDASAKSAPNSGLTAPDPA